MVVVRGMCLPELGEKEQEAQCWEDGWSDYSPIQCSHTPPQTPTAGNPLRGGGGVFRVCGGGEQGKDEGEGVQVSRISETPEAPRGLSGSFKGQPLQ